MISDKYRERSSLYHYSEASSPDHYQNKRPSIRDNYREVKTLIESIDTSMYAGDQSKPKQMVLRTKNMQSPAYRKNLSQTNNRHSLYLYERGKNTASLTNEMNNTKKRLSPKHSLYAYEKNQDLQATIAQVTKKNDELKAEIEGYAEIIQLKDRNIAKKGQIIENLERLTMKFETMIAQNSDKKYRAKQEYEMLKEKHSALQSEMNAQNAEIQKENDEIVKCKEAMHNLHRLKEVQARAIDEMRHELDKNKQIIENWKTKSQIQSMDANEMETKLRKSQDTISENQREINALTLRLDGLKEIEKDRMKHRKLKKAQMQKIDSLNKEVKRLSMNENKMMHRQSNQMDEFEKKISVLEIKLKQREKTISELQKSHVYQRKGVNELNENLLQDWKFKCAKLEKMRREKVSDLAVAQKENQRLLQRIREQDEVIHGLNRNRKSMNFDKHQIIRSDEELEEKENEIKRLQIQIIDKNIDLDRHEYENEELLRKIEQQHEKMVNKDAKLEEIKSALDVMLIERDRLIAETKEIKLRMNKFPQLQTNDIFE